MCIFYTTLNFRLTGGQFVCGQIMLAAGEAGNEVCPVSPSRGSRIYQKTHCTEALTFNESDYRSRLR
jgi:hypothetical protein